jgi:hypothetical protein
MAALEGRPGVDTTSIAAGSKREHVEELIGEPLREWESITGIEYCMYSFDGGVDPSPGGALVLLVMSVGTAGLWELFYSLDQGEATPDDMVGWEPKRLIISYDKDDTVLGIFAEGDQLPPDGKPTIDR